MVATTDRLQSEAVALLGDLIRFDTVNPPGNERPAIEHLGRYLTAAGFACQLLADDPARPNLVATLGDPDGAGAGPDLGFATRCYADPAVGLLG